MLVKPLSIALAAWCTLGAAYSLPPESSGVQRPFTNINDTKVSVVLGVMSQCPDAILCESVFDRVLQRVGDKVDLSLTFLGRVNASEPEFGVTCMHGAGECAGNIQELCAIKYTERQTWWRFVQCQNFQGRWQVGKPETAFKCANAAGIDWENDEVGRCAGRDASGKTEEGIKLLKQSVTDTANLGVQKSCTILISGKPVCIHDETWKQCEAGHRPEDFVKQINEEYSRLNAN